MSTQVKYPFYIVGIDLGGTKIAGGLVYYEKCGESPEVVDRFKVPTEAMQGPDKIVENVCNVVNTLIQNNLEKICDEEVLAVGIASAGRCNKNTGVVETATDNFPGFAGTAMCDLVSASVGLPAFILNDVQAHTLGEARWGAAQGSDYAVMLAIGTGIGGAVINDGKLMKGYHGFAGELGHVQVALGRDIPCTCGKHSHLEGIAAGCGIERVYKSRTGRDLTGPEITDLANAGDGDARYCLELSGRSIGQIIAGYQSIFDPEVIIISGSVVNAGPIWEDALHAGIEEEIIEEIKPNLHLVPAKLGDDAPIIGASENALDNLGQ